jgi:hypothetical protein
VGFFASGFCRALPGRDEIRYFRNVFVYKQFVEIERNDGGESAWLQQKKETP